MNEDWQPTRIDKTANAYRDKWAMARYLSYQAIVHPPPWRAVRQTMGLKYDRD